MLTLLKIKNVALIDDLTIEFGSGLNLLTGETGSGKSIIVDSLGALTGHIPLSSGFAWIGTIPAAIAFGTATLLEIAAYYIPWFDHLLDTIATPAAVVAGMVASASVMVDLPPVLKWGVALIGGGGAAGLLQGATVLLRLKSLAATGGAANALVSTVELFGATGTVILAIVLPFVCLALAILFCLWVFRKAGHIVFGRKAAEDPAIASDPAALQARYVALEAARAEVDRLYARWAELEDKGETR